MPDSRFCFWRILSQTSVFSTQGLTRNYRKKVTLLAGHQVALAVGGQNVFSTYPAESARAMSVGEKYSEYTPWGFNGSYYYVRLSYKWGN